MIRVRAWGRGGADTGATGLCRSFGSPACPQVRHKRYKALQAVQGLSLEGDEMPPLARVVTRDPSLPHQIILLRGGDAHTVVTCNCLGFRGIIARISPTQDPWIHYNNPDKHNNDIAEFVPRAHQQGETFYVQ